MPSSTPAETPDPHTWVATDPAELTGVRKAAVLLVSLGVESASHILRHLEDDEVEAISIEIAKIENASSKVVESVLSEYKEMAMAKQYITQGGMNFAKDALVQALGEQRADDIIMKIEAAMEVSAFHMLQTVETSQLTNFLQNEHPQTAALILAHLKPRKAADILAGLDENEQADIIYRLASMDKTSPELLEDIEDIIRQQMGSVFGTELSTTGGEEVAASILNAVSRSTEKSVLGRINERDPAMADEIKSLMFVFDDLVNLSDRDIQRLLTEIEQRDLALSLKAATPELKEKLLSNLSSRVRDVVEEEFELLGRVRVSDVEEAQNNIIEAAQELEEREEIVLASEEASYI